MFGNHTLWYRGFSKILPTVQSENHYYKCAVLERSKAACGNDCFSLCKILGETVLILLTMHIFCSCDLPLILRGEGEKEDWGDPSLDTPPNDEDQAPSFPELIPRIVAAISALGGRGVFPKLNWSAPKVGKKSPL